MTRRKTATGDFWRESPSRRAQIVHHVCESLQNAYGTPRYGNHDDPLDELVYIILSTRTAIEVAQKSFRTLKSRFPFWDDVLRSSRIQLQKILALSGLSVIKSRQIRAAFIQIRRDFGRCDLNGLRKQRQEEAETYLVSLPGVSTKVARCVMMYSLGAKVLPVDAHMHRIARRLGWIDRKRADQSHEELDALIPPMNRYAFHVDCISHGRDVCRPFNPKCGHCCLRKYCSFFKAGGTGT